MQTLLDEIIPGNIVNHRSSHSSKCNCSNCRDKDHEGETSYHPALGYGKSISREMGSRVAYHPSLGYGRPVSGEMEIGEDEFELVGTDDRKRIGDTKKAPFRWVCSLLLEFPDPDKPGSYLRFSGTGTLVSGRHVLTCGHNLYSTIYGSKGTKSVKLAKRVYAYPGRNGTSKPFGFSTASSLKLHPNWLKNQNARYDLGMIKLKSSLGSRTFTSLGGKQLGYWGSPTSGQQTRIIPFTKNNLQNRTANIAGYPGDKPFTLWWEANKINNASPSAGPELIYYEIDTCAGNSGSPVWLYNSKTGGRFLIAIHTGPCIPGSADCKEIAGTPCIPGRKRYSSNRGVLLSKTVINLFRSWMRTM